MAIIQNSMSGTLAQSTNLLPLFDHKTDKVIDRAQSTRLALTNYRGSCLVMFKQLVEST
jgi:hypothetical protein